MKTCHASEVNDFNPSFLCIGLMINPKNNHLIQFSLLPIRIQSIEHSEKIHR